MPAEPVGEQITQALTTALRGMDAGTYWYPPGRVIRARAFDAINFDDAAASTTTYWLVQESETEAELVSQEVRQERQLYLWLATKYPDDTRGDLAIERDGAAAYQTVVNRLVGDACHLVRQNFRLGGLALNAQVLDKDLTAYAAGYAVAQVRVQIAYEHATEVL